MKRGRNAKTIGESVPASNHPMDRNKIEFIDPSGSGEYRMTVDPDIKFIEKTDAGGRKASAGVCTCRAFQNLT